MTSFALLTAWLLVMPAVAGFDCKIEKTMAELDGLAKASIKVEATALAAKGSAIYSGFTERLGKVASTLLALHKHPSNKELVKELAHHTSTAAQVFATATANEAARWKMNIGLQFLKSEAPDKSLFSVLNAYESLYLGLHTAALSARATACLKDEPGLAAATDLLRELANKIKAQGELLRKQTASTYKRDLRDAHYEAIFSALECPCPVQEHLDPVKYHNAIKKNLLKSMVSQLSGDLAKCCPKDVTFITPSTLIELIDSPAQPHWNKSSCPDTSSFTAFEALVLRSYTGSCYEKINEALRSKDPELIKSCESVIDVLEIALGNFPDYRGTIARMVYLPQKVIDQYEPGQVVEDAAFMSTSRHESWDWSGSVKFIIKAKHGKNIETFSEHPHEGEVLLRPASRFKVLSKQHDGSRLVIGLEEIDEAIETPVLKTITPPGEAGQ